MVTQITPDDRGEVVLYRRTEDGRTAVAVRLAGETVWLTQAQIADPWKDWLSADSAHFRIHYRSEHRAQAERAALAAERAYPRVTAALQCGGHRGGRVSDAHLPASPTSRMSLRQSEADA